MADEVSEVKVFNFLRWIFVSIAIVSILATWSIVSVVLYLYLSNITVPTALENTAFVIVGVYTTVISSLLKPFGNIDFSK